MRLPVQPQGEAERGAAAAQERGQRRRGDPVSALDKLAAQMCAAMRRNDGSAHTDRVGGKATCVLHGDFDSLRWCNALVDAGEPFPREGGGHEHDLATRQRAQGGIEVVESSVGELQRDGVNPEHVFDWSGGIAVRAGTVAHPEYIARAIPDAVAGAFEHQIARQLLNRVNQTAPVKRAKSALERLLLAAAFRI